VDGAIDVVDDDRPADPELVAQPPCGRELVFEAAVGGQMLARVGLSRVEEVPAVLGVLSC
jgi:hypothetical protein